MQKVVVMYYAIGQDFYSDGVNDGRAHLGNQINGNAVYLKAAWIDNESPENIQAKCGRKAVVLQGKSLEEKVENQIDFGM